MKQHPLYFLIPLFVLLCLSSASIAQGGNLKSAPPEADETYATFSKAYQQLDVSQMQELYTDDALYMESRGPIKTGKESIAEGFESLFTWAREKNIKLDISFRFVKRDVRSDMIVDVGYYLLKRIDSEQKESASAGKFVVIQELQVDGTWRISLDSYNAAPTTAFFDTPE